MRRAFVLGLVALASTAGCGEADSVAPTPSALELSVRRARFGEVGDDHRVAYPVASFEPDGPFGASIELGGVAPGRSPTGVVTLRWEIAERAPIETTVDLADASARTIDGDAIWIGATLDGPVPVGVHRLMVDDAPFPFEVRPPADAIASRVRDVQLARGVTVDAHAIDPSETFAPSDTVHLVGCGDLGRASWVRARWRVGEAFDDAGTRTLEVEADTPDTCFAFDFRPHGGWPAGEHEAQLIVDAREVGRYAFTVVGE